MRDTMMPPNKPRANRRLPSSPNLAIIAVYSALHTVAVWYLIAGVKSRSRTVRD